MNYKKYNMTEIPFDNVISTIYTLLTN